MQIRARFIFLFSCLSFFAKANLQTIVVDINGHGNFTSIQAALNSLPENATAYRTIFIKKGIYREKIFIDKNFVALVGEDKVNTQIYTSNGYLAL
jgi:pectin methylesterase-like acyl-CoA thioesterase